MRLIDGEALERQLTLAIKMQECFAQTLGVEDDSNVQTQLETYRSILNGVKDMPTINNEGDKNNE